VRSKCLILLRTKPLPLVAFDHGCHVAIAMPLRRCFGLEGAVRMRVRARPLILPSRCRATRAWTCRNASVIQERLAVKLIKFALKHFYFKALTYILNLYFTVLSVSVSHHHPRSDETTHVPRLEQVRRRAPRARAHAPFSVLRSPWWNVRWSAPRARATWTARCSSSRPTSRATSST
jgi:hypothetical protein